MENNSSIKEIINNSLEQIRTIIDADTVVGKQLITPSGTVIIPISKISMGFASGGLDLPAEGKDSVKNFGGGGGTGLTVTPIGFLTVYADGRVEMLPMTQEKATPIEQVADLLDQAPAIINRIKEAISSVRPEEVPTDEAAEAEIESRLAADIAAESLSDKELKKLRKQEAKAAKKAAKAN